MLKAILEGKAGRVAADGNSEVQSWREVFRKREDLLTAVFFSRLRYLSENGEQMILALLVGDELAQSLKGIQEIIFWPQLKGLANRKHVEPDVLILFEDSLLLIEVKPPFGGAQKEDQWVAQVKSLILQRGVENSDVDVPEEFHFLALGRNTPEAEKSAASLQMCFKKDGLASVHRHEWVEVCKGIRNLANHERGRDLFIYKDWLDAFALFGLIEPPLPFGDLLHFAQIRISGWHTGMRAFNTPEISSSSTSVDWQALAEVANNMRLEALLWE